jgi:hypothetical protein
MDAEKFQSIKLIKRENIIGNRKNTAKPAKLGKMKKAGQRIAPEFVRSFTDETAHCKSPPNYVILTKNSIIFLAWECPQIICSCPVLTF